MSSSIVANSKRTTATRKRGKHKMVDMKTLKQQHGVPVAKSLRDTKKEMEEKKDPSDRNIYFMPHPDFPDRED